MKKNMLILAAYDLSRAAIAAVIFKTPFAVMATAVGVFRLYDYLQYRKAI